MKMRVVTWDWKESIDLTDLAEALEAVSGERVFLREVDTGGDEHAIVLSDEVLSSAEAVAGLTRYYVNEETE